MFGYLYLDILTVASASLARLLMANQLQTLRLISNNSTQAIVKFIRIKHGICKLLQGNKCLLAICTISSINGMYDI